MKKTILFFLAMTAAFQIGSAQFSIQKVVVEEFTGAWCGYCPDGAAIMDDLLSLNSNAIGVSLHNGDAMTTAEGDAVVSFYNDGFPTATFNRNGLGISRGQWISTANTMTQGAGAVTVSFDSLDYNSGTRSGSVVVRAQFTGPVDGDIRFNLFLVEESVIGSGSGYNQTNYYDNPGVTPYYGPGTITNYEHKHVLREMVGGSWGTAGIISSPVNFGANFSHSYNFTLPAGWDENEMHLVAVVQKYDGSAANQRKILNGEEMPLIAVTAVDDLNSSVEFMDVYPNPSSGRTTVAFMLKEMSEIDVEVVNMMGQHVATLGHGISGQGAHTLYWDGVTDAGQPVANGVYMVRLVSESGQSMVKRVILAR